MFDCQNCMDTVWIQSIHTYTSKKINERDSVFNSFITHFFFISTTNHIILHLFFKEVQPINNPAFFFLLFLYSFTLSSSQSILRAYVRAHTVRCLVIVFSFIHYPDVSLAMLFLVKTD